MALDPPFIDPKSIAIINSEEHDDLPTDGMFFPKNFQTDPDG
jgi:hypothetical protein